MTGPMTSAEVLQLWSDEPSGVDLLAFGAVADTVVDAVLDDELDRLALGVSGAWESGKTTVLRLVESALLGSGEAGRPWSLRSSPILALRPGRGGQGWCRTQGN
ncbi:MAG TPA: hypothetical protein VG455_07945 [Acidimicrobiales bacterium]|nr:hypothetical protein [Acidimicrobiales bacterium]